MRERGDDQIKKAHEDHKGIFTEERDKAKEKETEWKKKYHRYHFKELEKKHKKLKQEKMKKIKEALAIKYAPFDKKEMTDFQNKYKETQAQKLEDRKKKLEETQSQRKKFFEEHPKPKYLHKFYNQCKEEFKEIKNR